MEILCGIPNTCDAFIQTATGKNNPLLISANSLWNDKKKCFQGHGKLWELEVPLALDCGGFVAMNRYGGYRWTMADYVELATEMRPQWWAAMDYCCEPEIAKNHEEVEKRIRMTVFSLAETYASVISWNHQLPGYQATNPMPVLQGWNPEDYKNCIGLMEDHIYSDEVIHALNITGWPNLVGLGSVCRRKLQGKDGIISILNTVDRYLPSNVKLHLFGVKSQAAEILKDHPRIQSVDSMAWNMAARWEAYKGKFPKTQKLLASHMGSWIDRQKQRTAPEAQMALI